MGHGHACLGLGAGVQGSLEENVKKHSLLNSPLTALHVLFPLPSSFSLLYFRIFASGVVSLTPDILYYTLPPA